jgi:hypothetical protein
VRWSSGVVPDGEALDVAASLDGADDVDVLLLHPTRATRAPAATSAATVLEIRIALP